MHRMQSLEAFTKAYTALNNAQKQAVDTIDGPVMVVAGPGTGKTEVLALRIANIRHKTDTPSDGILCLTFTNSGVKAMRERLREYMGVDAGKVNIATYHSFGKEIIEEFFTVIGLVQAPRTLEDDDTVSLVDHILNTHDWQYLRPRGDVSKYYRDLKSLISILKRENISAEKCIETIDIEVARLRDDPASISSRGESKGQLKKAIVTEIDGLERTREVARFYELYEAEKTERCVMDFDDILAYMTAIVRESEDARATIRERYLYVLVDEHQDSSGAQNAFLNCVWNEKETINTPNIFVVGDDRQLIYGFGGASLVHFESFTSTFSDTKVITLTDNYRSTQPILDTADTLLSSHLAAGKLVSHRTEIHPVRLVEAMYPRDEIIQAGLFFKSKIAEGTPADQCALLVPKNSSVRTAVTILRDLGLPVSSSQSLRLFDTTEYQSLLTILRVVHNPYDTVALGVLVLDPLSGIPPLSAHRFLHDSYTRNLSIDMLASYDSGSGLFGELDPISQFGKKLATAVDAAAGKSVYALIQYIGELFFISESVVQPGDHALFVRRIEIIRSFLHLALSLEERQPKATTGDFIAYIERLRDYGEHMPLAVFGNTGGIRVMTLHGSKGLQFDVVWIAHMNERSLMSSKNLGFTLPESINEKIEKKSEEVARRELYVAITRAKRFCTLSYARESHKGGDEKIASIIEAMPDNAFEFIPYTPGAEMSMRDYVATTPAPEPTLSRADLRKLVAENYTDSKVSVTSITAFFDCPWKWYFRCFLQVPEPVAEALQFGIIVHGTIERIVKNPDEKVEHAIAEEIKKNHIVNLATAKRFTKEATLATQRFLDTMYDTLWERRESEKALSYHDEALPELLITGKIDLLENDGGNAIRVTDFKTGKAKTAKDIEKRDDEGRLSDYMRQLAMYSYLIHRTYKGHQRVERSRLYFVEAEDEKNALYETTIGDEEIDLLIRDIKEYDAALKKGDWTERTCHWKNYGGKETECPYCKRAKMYV